MSFGRDSYLLFFCEYFRKLPQSRVSKYLCIFTSLIISILYLMFNDLGTVFSITTSYFFEKLLNYRTTPHLEFHMLNFFMYWKNYSVFSCALLIYQLFCSSPAMLTQNYHILEIFCPLISLFFFHPKVRIILNSTYKYGFNWQFYSLIP